MTNMKITELDNVTFTGVTGDLTVNDNGTMLVYTGTEWEPVISQQDERLDRIEKMLEKIADRLAILEDPEEGQLEQFKTLQDIYKKYKFTEALVGKKKNG